jgi:glycosyltransferase involved in cell wall biosynthesis
MEAYPNLRPGVAEEAGGAGFQLLQIARGLRDRGWPVSFVVGDYGQPFHEVIDGFDVYRANRVTYDKSVPRSLANLVRLWRGMRAARARHYVLRSTRFLSFFVMAYARLLGGRYTFMVANLPHCLREELEGLPKVFRTLYALSLRWGHAVTVQSLEQQQLLLANFGIKAPVIPNGIAVPPLADPAATADHDIVWVASLKPQKRADVLLQMVRLLPGRRFLVAGGPGPDLTRSRELAAALAAEPNVTFLGFVPPDRVGDVYARARLFLNTSDWEGFPNGFLYAWSRGLPVASLKVDPDGAVVGGDLGLVIDDPARLAAAADALLDDPARLQAMAARCHAHVAAHHSLDRLVEAFVAALPA